MASFAHQTEASSVVLAEKKNNVWVLQISASLTAFQQKVKTHFADTPYKTPEEFQAMELEHIRDNIHMHFNGHDHIVLKNGIVRLGHETKVIFEVEGIPSDLNAIEVTNTVFKDIHKSKSMLVILKKDSDKNQFILDEGNQYSVSLALKDDAFVEVKTSEASIFSLMTLNIVFGILVLGFNLKQVYKSKLN